MSQDTNPEDKTVYQPIHPSIRAKLDPEYVRFHDNVLAYIKPSEQQPWHPSARDEPSPFARAAQKTSAIGSQTDHDAGDFQVRVFTPRGPPSTGEGWPVLVWFHGGGFVMGGLDSENGFLTHVCHYVRCIVASINYRHAPEFRHPAAFTDGYNGLLWVIKHATELFIDRRLIAIGGLSAGGCIAATTTLRAIEEDYPIDAQILICPVLNNTATVEGQWAESQFSPWLTPSRMTWYRDLYFPSASEPWEWHASPVYAPAKLMALCPPTFLAIAECDLLAPEAQEYADSLSSQGVSVDKRVYTGGTHSLLVLAGIHKLSQQLVHDACGALAKAFGCDYDPRFERPTGRRTVVIGLIEAMKEIDG